MTQTVELAIGGMTCASCAARVQKKLNKLDGVTASVNYATEKALVDHPDTVAVEDLVGVVESIGYLAAVPRVEAQDEQQADPLRLRLLITSALALPVLVLSMVPAFHFDGWQWLALVLTTPVVVWGAWPFHRAAAVNLRHRATTMDTLVSLGVLAAYLWSVWALFLGGGDTYLEVASVVPAFLLAGRHAEARAKRHAGAAMRALLDLGAKDVTVLHDGSEQRIAITALAVGQRFVVRPGEKIATDGVIDEGTSAVDAALVTGEAVPVEVGPGDPVVGATLNVGGRLVVTATRVGADTRLAQLARLVEQAQNGRAEVQRLADRVSAVFVPVVIALAALTFTLWLTLDGSAHAAFTAGVAVLIIACPCALGLATPTALMVGTGRGAQLGIVVKGPQILESTRRIDTVVLDKTGTVTTGQLTLHDVVADSPDDVLRLAGAAESASTHPVAQAITAAAGERGGPLPAVTGAHETPGLGVRGVVDGRSACVGRASFVGDVPARFTAAQDAAEAAGRTVVFVAVDGAVRGVLVVGDTVKPTSAAAVRELRELGLTPVLLTGDNRRAAQAVAAAVGIDEVVAGVLPQDKVAEVERLRAGGRVVAMVGDGVNDAAALAAADLGIAMGSGSDVAIEASDLTLVRSDLRSAAVAIRLARATLRTIKGNLVWAFGYNVAALPLAALGLLNPVIAGAAMAASSVFVVTNSLRLRRFT